MVRDLKTVGRDLFNNLPIQTSDLHDNVELSKHSYIPVIAQKGTGTKHLFWGGGVEHADYPTGWRGIDLQVADDDGGTNAAAAEGMGRFAVYPDEDFDIPKATGDEMPLSYYRDEIGKSTGDRDMFGLRKPGARKDEFIVWEVKIDPSQHGMQTYQEGSGVDVTASKRDLTDN